MGLIGCPDMPAYLRVSARTSSQINRRFELINSDRPQGLLVVLWCLIPAAAASTFVVGNAGHLKKT